MHVCVFMQVDMLVPGLLGSYDEYGQRYCVDPSHAPPARGVGPGGRQWQEDPYRWVMKDRRQQPAASAHRLAKRLIPRIVAADVCVQGATVGQDVGTSTLQAIAGRMVQYMGV
jgi:hypothetical protein